MQHQPEHTNTRHRNDLGGWLRVGTKLHRVVFAALAQNRKTALRHVMQSKASHSAPLGLHYTVYICIHCIIYPTGCSTGLLNHGSSFRVF